MKKIIAIALLIPGLSFGANVNQNQVKNVQAKTQLIISKATEILSYANSVNHLFDRNFSLGVQFSTVTVTIPDDIRDQYIDVQKYQRLKSDLETLVNSLP